MLFNVMGYDNQVIGQVDADDIVEAWEKAMEQYGNILDVRSEKIPEGPYVLYHGTLRQNIDGILNEGLFPTPEFIYLARTIETAYEQACEAAFERGEMKPYDIVVFGIKDVKYSDLVSEELAWEMDEDIAMDKHILPDRIFIAH